MIFAAPLSQYLVVRLVAETGTGGNVNVGFASMFAIVFGWLPGAIFGGFIASLGDNNEFGSGSHFQIVTGLGFFPTVVSCAALG